MITLVHHPISEPYWMTNGAGERIRTCNVPSIPNNYAGLYPETTIDATIAPFIAWLNGVGLATNWCCSGVDEDHSSRGMPGWKRAYIAFASPLPADLLALLVAAEIIVEDDRIIRFPPCDNAHLHREWAVLESLVRQWAESLPS